MAVSTHASNALSEENFKFTHFLAIFIFFREYIASDEPINTKEKKFILGLHDLTVTWNKENINQN
jgi:hypothetical protein